MAWWLVDSIINGTFDEDYPIMKKNDDDVTVLGGDEDVVTFTVPEDAVGAADTISLDLNVDTDTLNFGTPLPGGMGKDHISFSGYSGTAYDDPKYYALDFGDDPYPTVGSLDDTVFAVGSGNTASAEYGFPSKPQPNLKDGSTQKYQEDKGIADL